MHNPNVRKGPGLGSILHSEAAFPRGRGFLLGSCAMWSELVDLCLIIVTIGAFAIWRRNHPAKATPGRASGPGR